MYDDTTMDLITKGLKLIQDIKPLLEDPSKVESFIKGVDNAKRIIADAKDAALQLEQATELEIKNAKESARLEELAAKTAEQVAALGVLDESLKQKQTDIDAAMRTAEAKLADASVKFGNATKLQADAEDLFARAETELHSAKALKGDYQIKLNALVQAEG